jgi:VWFA-related protein
MDGKWLRCCVGGAAALALGIWLAGYPFAAAQTAPSPAQPAPPEEKTAPKPDASTPAPVNDATVDNTQGEYRIRSNVQLVTTPVTVFDSARQYVYDLDQDEFQVFDNDVPQRIVQFDSEMRRLSLVIVVETNDNTEPFLESVRPLGSLFSDMVMGPQGEVALLTYSDHVDMPLDFTTDGDKLDSQLRTLHGRGGGMHLDDALVRALSMLNDRPKADRKVAIVFSDGFNIGSKMRRSEIVKGAMNSNITIYHLGFSPLKGLWKRQAQDPQPDLVAESVARAMPPNVAPTPTNAEDIWDPNDINLISILLGLGEEAKKPIFKDSMIYFARYSGGQSYQKWDKNTVQQYLSQIATDIHSQYEIAYAPTQPIAVGYHKIEVKVRRPGAKVRSRAGWFYQGEPPRGVVVK